jgi:ParB-like chromosome segregation protein Spo0J
MTAPAVKSKTLRLDQVTVDSALQARVTVDEGVVQEYAELMKARRNFPPLDVVHDAKARKFYLIDGYHRLAAARLAGVATVGVSVTEGTLDDARWLACGANKSHGLRRTNADKRKAARAALLARPHLSDSALAEHVGVSGPMIGAYRAELRDAGVIADVVERVGLDGVKKDVSPYSKAAVARRLAIAQAAAKKQARWEHCPTCRGSGMVKK